MDSPPQYFQVFLVTPDQGGLAEQKVRERERLNSSDFCQNIGLLFWSVQHFTLIRLMDKLALDVIELSMSNCLLLCTGSTALRTLVLYSAATLYRVCY